MNSCSILKSQFSHYQSAGVTETPQQESLQWSQLYEVHCNPKQYY